MRPKAMGILTFGKMVSKRKNHYMSTCWELWRPFLARCGFLCIRGVVSNRSPGLGQAWLRGTLLEIMRLGHNVSPGGTSKAGLPFPFPCAQAAGTTPPLEKGHRNSELRLCDLRIPDLRNVVCEFRFSQSRFSPPRS